MTSVLSSFGQIHTQSKYFIAVNTNTATVSTSINPSDPTIAAFSLGSLLGPVALAPGDVTTDAAIIATSGYTTVQINQGTLFRDLGRKVVICDQLGAGATQLAIYRQMQIVNGPLTEGNPGPTGMGAYPTIYVKVWSADGSELDSVCVARTG
jgi:hypothetical protein